MAPADHLVKSCRAAGWGVVPPEGQDYNPRVVYLGVGVRTRVWPLTCPLSRLNLPRSVSR